MFFCSVVNILVMLRQDSQVPHQKSLMCLAIDCSIQKKSGVRKLLLRIFMKWIFVAFFIASLLHMGEEFFYPGGFLETIRRLNSKIAPAVNRSAAIIINSLQLLSCIVVMAIGKNALVFSMSVAALLFINGVIHVLACIKTTGYVPGVITGVLLYVPLSTFSYYHFVSSGQLSANGIALSCMLGMLYQAVPVIYFVSARLLKRTR